MPLPGAGIPTNVGETLWSCPLVIRPHQSAHLLESIASSGKRCGQLGWVAAVGTSLRGFEVHDRGNQALCQCVVDLEGELLTLLARCCFANLNQQIEVPLHPSTRDLGGVQAFTGVFMQTIVGHKSVDRVHSEKSEESSMLRPIIFGICVLGTFAYNVGSAQACRRGGHVGVASEPSRSDILRAKARQLEDAANREDASAKAVKQVARNKRQLAATLKERARLLPESGADLLARAELAIAEAATADAEARAHSKRARVLRNQAKELLAQVDQRWVKPVHRDPFASI